MLNAVGEAQLQHCLVDPDGEFGLKSLVNVTHRDIMQDFTTPSRSKRLDSPYDGRATDCISGS